ncbi:MAG: flagellin [Chloroflexi bacterium]|nr:flagellin [Chloroflexota bacterium]
MDKVVVTAMLLIAGVVSSVFAFKSIFPVVAQSSDAMTSMERRMNEQLQTQIQIVHAVQTGSNIEVWVKNVGSLRVGGLESADLFFGPEGNFARIPYSTGTPNWQYVVENATDWNPSATIRITIFGYTPLNSGRYFVKLVLPSGVSDEYFFSW